MPWFEPCQPIHLRKAKLGDATECLHARNDHSPRFVSQSTPVVKLSQSTEVDYFGTVRPMNLTFRERIEWIKANRPVFRGSMGRMSQAAGMSRTSLAKTVERSELNGGQQKMEDHNLKALAAEAEVNEEWLRTGKGDPNAVRPTGGNDLSLRKDAAEMLQAGHGLTEERAWLLMRDADPKGRELKHYYLAGLALLRREPERSQSLPAEDVSEFLSRNRRRMRT